MGLRRSFVRSLSVVLFAVGVVTASTAFAQTPGEAPREPSVPATSTDQSEYRERPTHELVGALSFYTQSNGFTDFPYLLHDVAGRFRLLGNDEEGAPTMDLVAQWSFFAFFGPDCDPALRTTNPNLFATLGSRVGVVRAWGGAGVALPVIAAFGDGVGLACSTSVYYGYFRTAGMRGFLEPWGYAVSHVGVHARGGLEARYEEGSIGAELALGIMASIDPRVPLYEEHDHQLGGQLRVFGEARLHELLSIGGQLGLVFQQALGESRSYYRFLLLSLEPFVRMHFEPGFVGLRFLMNVIPFSFDDGGVWSLTLEGGVELE